MQVEGLCGFGIVVTLSQQLGHEEWSLLLLKALNGVNPRLPALEMSPYLEKVLQPRLLELSELVKLAELARLRRGPVSPGKVNAIYYDFCEELQVHEIVGGAGPFSCRAGLGDENHT